MPTILALGRSNMQGFGLPDPDRAWPVLLGESLEKHTGAKITVVRRRLNMEGNPTDYLARVFAEVRPDVAITTVTVWDYATARIQDRLNERVGKRIGDLARAIEKRTLPKDTTKKPGLLHRSLRKAGRRWVGTAPTRTRAEVLQTVDRVYRFLARQEDTAIVMTYALPGSATSALNPGYQKAADEFREHCLQRAEELHFHWADMNVNDSLSDHRQGDSVHMADSGHAIIAAEFEEATLAALCDTYPALGVHEPSLTAAAQSGMRPG